MSEILEKALAIEGGVGRLADALGVRQNVVSNWKARGLPYAWQVALKAKYGHLRVKKSLRVAA